MLKERAMINDIIKAYIKEIGDILGKNFLRAYVYGSYVRNQYDTESDIDIAIFTNVPSSEFYLLINQIAEITFEYNVISCFSK